MSSVGGAASGGLDPAVYSLKEMGETAIFSAAFGPAGPLVNQVQNVIVSQVLPMMPDGPAKQLVGFLLDPIGSLLTMLMPPGEHQAAAAGYAPPKAGSHGAMEAEPQGQGACSLNDDPELKDPGGSAYSNPPSPQVGPGPLDGRHKHLPTHGSSKTPPPPLPPVAPGTCGAPPPPVTTSSSDAVPSTTAHLQQLQSELAEAQKEMNALEVLQRDFIGAEMAGGIIHSPDGALTMNDLHAIMEGPYDANLKQAAQYFLAHPGKFRRLDNAGIPGQAPDGRISVLDIMTRKSQVEQNIDGLRREIADEKAKLKEENLMSPPPRANGAPPPPPPPPVAPTSTASPSTGSASQLEGAPPASMPETPKSDSTAKSEGTSTTKAANDGVFFSGIASAIDKTYSDIEKAEQRLDKLIAQDNPKASEQDIQKAQRELTKLSTRAQMLESLYSQMMQMMQNMSKLYNEIAMNAIRKIG